MTEVLEFKLTLSGRYWDKKPAYEVLLNDEVVVSAVVDNTSEEQFDIEFSREVNDDSEYRLIVRFLNKEDTDTVENADKTAILKDMVLNIDGLSIDGIDVDNLLWTNSEYFGTDGNSIMTECINLGKNGNWVFKFSTPYYIWLLENM
jgi:hypothetical protein